MVQEYKEDALADDSDDEKVGDGGKKGGGAGMRHSLAVRCG